MSTFYIIRDEDDLTHHGIKGQKWGIRRFQNADGSYTSEGLKRRATKRDIKKYTKMANKVNRDLLNSNLKRSTEVMKKTEEETAKIYGKKDIKTSEDAKLYTKIYDEQFEKLWAQDTLSFLSKNKNFQKAQEFAKKFDRSSYSAAMKDNFDFIEELKKQAGYK